MGDFIVLPATADDLTYIDYLQKKNAEQLSFYPKQVYEREIPNFRIWIAWLNNEPCGYIYHGAIGGQLRIHQACIQYDLRGKLYGAALIGDLMNRIEGQNVTHITLRCGSDIEANGFWRSMGFYCQHVSQGGVRRMRDINNWRFDISAQLFDIEVNASEKKQDASVWRKRDKTVKISQFSRGDKIAKYRQSVIDDNS